MKEKFILLILIVTIVLATSCSNQNNSVDSLSPFQQVEGWVSDETGYIDGKDIINTLDKYGLWEDIKKDIGDEYATFVQCTAEIRGYDRYGKKTAVLLIQHHHLQLYVLLSYDGSVWKSDGYTYQIERDAPAYRVEVSADSSSYWLVLEKEVAHGTGHNRRDEVWINPDGSIAAQYPLEGWSDFLTSYTANNGDAWISYSARPNYDGNHTISLDYNIDFEFKYNDKLKSIYSSAVWEYWHYDLEKSELVFEDANPQIPPELNNAVGDGDSIIWKYSDCYEKKVEHGKILTLEDWEALF